MAAIENILAWAKQERARLSQQLDELESGRLHIVEKHAQPPGWLEIDTTAQTIATCREYLSELSAIIALNPEIVPSEPAAPAVPRFIPPVAPPTPAPPAPAASQPAPAGFLHGLLHHSMVEHADWVVGWGVVKGQPPRWEFAGIYQTHTEADAAAAALGEGYYARWGSYNTGAKEFTSGPSFDRPETL